MLNGSPTLRRLHGPSNQSTPEPRDVVASPESFVCVSPTLLRLVLQAETVAPRLQIASLEGESGTGKHLFARMLHRNSRFAAAPFRRTDAREWLANESNFPPPGGTLYLDRIDLLSSSGQQLLLSFVKATQCDFTAIPRFLLLTSSHLSLRQLAAHGRFLPDLAFRLTAVRFSLPPLREHREDIAPIAQAILERLCHRYQQPIATLSPGALQLLIQHSWPGNVRELSSVLEAALFDSPSGTIDPAALHLAPEPQAPSPSVPAAESPVPMTLDAAIRHHIQLVLRLNHGNKLRAARQLGISRSTLYRILAEQSLRPPSSISS